MRLRAEELTSTEERAFSPPARPRIVAMWSGGVVVKEMPSSGRLTVGRSKACDISIDDSSVSRQHAIFYCGDSFEVEDLGSTNGTMVGGARLAPNMRTPVEGGALIGIGVAVVVVQGAAPPPLVLHPSSDPVRPRDVIVADDAMRELHRIVGLVAKGDLSIILLGETGTGKDVLASNIHRRSARALGPYVCVNCAALPDALLESELFGHERGAFTGALHAKPGLVEQADGGTLFLDEIAELPFAMQAKLLRVLENREVLRVGALRPRRVDIRIISATNRNLLKRVADQTFRTDLYFRLNGIMLTIPPLRDRPDEILPLAREFIREFCARSARRPLAMTDAALTLLRAHDWPGNVRELRNAVERAVTLSASDCIDACHLSLQGLGVPSSYGESSDGRRPTTPIGGRTPAGGRIGLQEDARRAAQACERERIAAAMDGCGGNQTRAAEVLGISRRTLVARLTQFGFARPLKDRGAASG